VAADETEADETILVTAAQANPAAFAPLYLRYRTPVLAYCLRRLGDPRDAEDVASVVFVKAIRALPGFHDRDGSFRAWLFRIAHNEVVDLYKRRERHPETALSLETARRDGGRSPEDAALLADERLRVHQALRSLPERERNVLELRLVGLETDEIARSLDITTQNVRTAQSRAIARLRELVTPSDFNVPTRRTHA